VVFNASSFAAVLIICVRFGADIFGCSTWTKNMRSARDMSPRFEESNARYIIRMRSCLDNSKYRTAHSRNICMTHRPCGEKTTHKTTTTRLLMLHLELEQRVFGNTNKLVQLSPQRSQRRIPPNHLHHIVHAHTFGAYFRLSHTHTHTHTSTPETECVSQSTHCKRSAIVVALTLRARKKSVICNTCASVNRQT
jgi:hypothetical protein